VVKWSFQALHQH